MAAVHTADRLAVPVLVLHGVPLAQPHVTAISFYSGDWPECYAFAGTDRFAELLRCSLPRRKSRTHLEPPGFLTLDFFRCRVGQQNIFWDMMQAVPFVEILEVLALWFCISVPMVFLGAYFGYRKPVEPYPVVTSNIPRQVRGGRTHGVQMRTSYVPEIFLIRRDRLKSHDPNWHRSRHVTRVPRCCPSSTRTATHVGYVLQIVRPPSFGVGFMCAHDHWFRQVVLVLLFRYHMILPDTHSETCQPLERTNRTFGKAGGEVELSRTFINSSFRPWRFLLPLFHGQYMRTCNSEGQGPL